MIDLASTRIMSTKWKNISNSKFTIDLSVMVKRSSRFTLYQVRLKTSKSHLRKEVMERQARKRELVLEAAATLLIVRGRRQDSMSKGGSGRQNLIRLSGVSMGQCKK